MFQKLFPYSISSCEVCQKDAIDASQNGENAFIEEPRGQGLSVGENNRANKLSRVLGYKSA